MSLRNNRESCLIKAIQKVISPSSQSVQIGIGDDAAVVAPIDGQVVLCCDAMVEGVHFELRWCEPKVLGRKALVACLSDVVAINGKPHYALVTLALPKSLGTEFVEDFYRGMQEFARSVEIDLVGGDLTLSPRGVFIDVSCIGSVTRPIRRSGAKLGDLLAVSGFLGAASAGLEILKKDMQGWERLRNAHLNPRPRLDLLPGLNKSTSLCTSMIDVSDGLSTELMHLAQQSQVGFEAHASKIPIDPDAAKLASELHLDPLHWALHGGEEYQLLVTVDSTSFAEHGLADDFTLIGRVVPEARGVTLILDDGRKEPLEARGWDPFV